MHSSLGQSVFDYLVILVPEITEQLKAKDFINPKAAKSLFNIWKDEDSKINSRLYRRPTTMSSEDIATMEKSELVKSVGDKIEITSKGAEVIRVMVLGDNNSIFEDNGETIDYEKALAKSKQPTLTAGRKIRTASKHEDQWWNRFELARCPTCGNVLSLKAV
tara:strand:+ start:3608 stop:4093 length:486 start_codon:yes stop_codon:yes gene_type:complete